MYKLTCLSMQGLLVVIFNTLLPRVTRLSWNLVGCSTVVEHSTRNLVIEGSNTIPGSGERNKKTRFFLLIWAAIFASKNTLAYLFPVFESRTRVPSSKNTLAYFVQVRITTSPRFIGACTIKSIKAVIRLCFATAIHFHPRLMFGGKAGAYQNGDSCDTPLWWLVPEGIFLVVCDPSMNELWAT
jgi:hypothetical protein